MYNSRGGRWSVTSLGITERAIDVNTTQPCVHMYVSCADRWSPTSLGLRTLHLDQPQTQPNSGHNVWVMCVFHIVVDGV